MKEDKEWKGGEHRRSNSPEDRMKVEGTTTTYLITLGLKHLAVEPPPIDKEYFRSIVKELQIRGFTEEELQHYFGPELKGRKLSEYLGDAERKLCKHGEFNCLLCLSEFILNYR